MIWLCVLHPTVSSVEGTERASRVKLCLKKSSWEELFKADHSFQNARLKQGKKKKAAALRLLSISYFLSNTKIRYHCQLLDWIQE